MRTEVHKAGMEVGCEPNCVASLAVPAALPDLSEVSRKQDREGSWFFGRRIWKMFPGRVFFHLAS